MKIIVLILCFGLVFNQDFGMEPMEDLSSVVLPEVSLNMGEEGGDFGTGLGDITEQPIIIPTQRPIFSRTRAFRIQALPRVQMATSRAGTGGAGAGVGFGAGTGGVGAAPSYGGYGARIAPIAPVVRAGPISPYGAKPTALPTIRPTAVPRTSPVYKTNPPALPTAAPRVSPTYRPSALPTARPTAGPRTTSLYGASPAVIPTAAPRTSAVYNAPRPAIRVAQLPIVRATVPETY